MSAERAKALEILCLLAAVKLDGGDAAFVRREAEKLRLRPTYEPSEPVRNRLRAVARRHGVIEATPRPGPRRTRPVDVLAHPVTRPVPWEAERWPLVPLPKAGGVR